MNSPIEELKKSKGDLYSSFFKGRGTETFQDQYTEIMDQYFRRSLQESSAGQKLFRNKYPFALIALGGYGRRDLCLFSDIDVMVLFGSRIPSMAKSLVGDIFYPLWDAGLELGYGTRSIKDCLGVAKGNFEALTSMMDARFICGDSPLFLAFLADLQKKAVHKRAMAFKRWLIEKHELRMAIFGDASYLLEPNLKEGIGGLRDFHYILWLAKAFLDLKVPRDLEYLGELSHTEYDDLMKNVEFIRLVRNRLHRLSGRKNDRLTYDYQEKIAESLGYQEQNDVLGVEHFLGRLHRAMASLKSIHRSFVLTHLSHKNQLTGKSHWKDLPDSLHLTQGEISFDSATSILSNPFVLMEIFEAGCRLGVPLSLEAKRLVREFLYLVDDRFRRSTQAIEGFLLIINHQRAFEALDAMLEVGFLDAFIPEFGQIRDRVQFDSYHIFPVGTHSLQTVRNLKDLPKEKDILLLDIFTEISDPELLFLGALFHDIGKTGKSHARRGALITRDILERIGYDDTRGEEILFLVAHHLLLTETATRRDLNDEKVVVQAARIIENPERLKMLYLLTWADGKATGPRAWNEWTENLVEELFFKLLHTFGKGELATPDATFRVRQTVLRLKRETEGQVPADELDELIEVMTPRYLFETKPGDVVRHIMNFRSLRDGFKSHPSSTFHLDARDGAPGSVWDVTFIAKDRPGLFSDIAGVMALNNINILAAQVYTWRDGTAVDVFKVSSPLDPLHSAEIWNKVRKDLGEVLRGELALSSCLQEKALPSILWVPKSPVRAPEVIVDNDASDFFTVIEVFAGDRIGLLYRITHTLFGLGLDIRTAKIATKADQIADVFYVRDLEGQKILDKERVEEIKKALLHELKQG
jgi:[protein-PII] uridylyltransferase